MVGPILTPCTTSSFPVFLFGFNRLTFAFLFVDSWHQKPISGAKHRPPKISKSASLSQDEIEIEVAEVLYGMTRQFESLPEQDSHKLEARDVDGGSGNETKSRVSSPSSMSPSPAALPSSNLHSIPTPLPTIGLFCTPNRSFSSVSPTFLFLR